MSKILVSALAVMCVLLLLAMLFGHPLSNNFLNDYQTEMATFDKLNEYTKTVGEFIQSAYQAFTGGAGIIDTIFNPKAEPYGLYHHQPSMWIALCTVGIHTPRFAVSDAEIDLFFDTVYSNLQQYMSAADAVKAMNEFSQKVYFFYDAKGALFVPYYSSDFDYVDDLRSRDFITGFRSWFEAVGRDIQNWNNKTYVVNGSKLKVYSDILDGGLMNKFELRDAGLAAADEPYSSSGIIGVLPFDRGVWHLCLGNAPTSWYLIGGIEI